MAILPHGPQRIRSIPISTTEIRGRCFLICARDDRYVAVKITVSEVKESGELKILQALSTLPIHHPGSSHITQLLDHFNLIGPNGSHDCLVLELVGPNIADIVESYCKDDRLPSRLAKVFAKQALQGLDFLAANNIGHRGKACLYILGTSISY